MDGPRNPEPPAPDPSPPEPPASPPRFEEVAAAPAFHAAPAAPAAPPPGPWDAATVSALARAGRGHLRRFAHRAFWLLFLWGVLATDSAELAFLWAGLVPVAWATSIALLRFARLRTLTRATPPRVAILPLQGVVERATPDGRQFSIAGLRLRIGRGTARRFRQNPPAALSLATIPPFPPDQGESYLLVPAPDGARAEPVKASYEVPPPGPPVRPAPVPAWTRPRPLHAVAAVSTLLLTILLALLTPPAPLVEEPFEPLMESVVAFSDANGTLDYFGAVGQPNLTLVDEITGRALPGLPAAIARPEGYGGFGLLLVYDPTEWYPAQIAIVPPVANDTEVESWGVEVLQVAAAADATGPTPTRVSIQEGEFVHFDYVDPEAPEEPPHPTTTLPRLAWDALPGFLQAGLHLGAQLLKETRLVDPERWATEPARDVTSDDAYREIMERLESRWLDGTLGSLPRPGWGSFALLSQSLISASVDLHSITGCDLAPGEKGLTRHVVGPFVLFACKKPQKIEGPVFPVRARVENDDGSADARWHSLSRLGQSFDCPASDEKECKVPPGEYRAEVVPRDLPPVVVPKKIEDEEEVVVKPPPPPPAASLRLTATPALTGFLDAWTDVKFTATATYSDGSPYPCIPDYMLYQPPAATVGFLNSQSGEFWAAGEVAAGRVVARCGNLVSNAILVSTSGEKPPGTTTPPWTYSPWTTTPRSYSPWTTSPRTYSPRTTSPTTFSPWTTSPFVEPTTTETEEPPETSSSTPPTSASTTTSAPTLATSSTPTSPAPTTTAASPVEVVITSGTCSASVVEENDYVIRYAYALVLQGTVRGGVPTHLTAVGGPTLESAQASSWTGPGTGGRVFANRAEGDPESTTWVLNFSSGSEYSKSSQTYSGEGPTQRVGLSAYDYSVSKVHSQTRDVTCG